MLAPQGHLRAAFEDLKDVPLLVLAAEADEETGFNFPDQEFLELPERGPDPDPHGPFLADHALPEGVVAVQGDHLVGGKYEGMDPSRQERAQCGEEQGSIRDVSQVVAPGVVIVVHGVSCEVASVDHGQTGDTCQPVGDLGLNGLEDFPPREVGQCPW